jgi:hypothetical protein
MMTPCPCEQHARTGSPHSLTETYSHRRLGCTDGQGNHTDCSSDAAQTAIGILLMGVLEFIEYRQIKKIPMDMILKERT